jgi:chromosome partitioning protein
VWLVRTISIINQKGGCGKTTTAINLAAMLAKRGLRTLLVDMDPQSHCAAGLGIPETRIDLDIGDAMLAADGRLDPSRLLWKAGRNLDLAPSRMKLAGLEAARGGLADKADKDRRLAKVLERFKGDYDVAVVDCSPSIGLLTFNALTASDCVLVPVETGFFSLQGATKQINTIKTLGKRLGHVFQVSVLATIHDDQSSLSRDLLEELRRRFDRRVAPVVIRRDNALREAASFGQTIIDYQPASPGAEDYAALAAWLMQSNLLDGTAVADMELEPEMPIVEVPRRNVEPAPTAPAHGQGNPLDAMLAAAASARGEMLSRSGTGGAAAVAEPVAQVSRAEDLLRRAMRFVKREPGAAGQTVETQIASAPATAIATAEALATRTHPTLELVRSEIKPLPKADTLKHLFGVRQTAHGVLFVQPAAIGTTVQVAGDFNNWTPQASPMKLNRDLGVFEVCIPMSAGRHQYRLVIDGHWTADAHNPDSETNPFGEPNSVVLVGGR